jgi:hypothetical protein
MALASSTCNAAYPVAAVNDNERADVNWGNGGGWAGGTNPPDWVVTRVLDHRPRSFAVCLWPFVPT